MGGGSKCLLCESNTHKAAAAAVAAAATTTKTAATTTTKTAAAATTTATTTTATTALFQNDQWDGQGRKFHGSSDRTWRRIVFMLARKTPSINFTICS